MSTLPAVEDKFLGISCIWTVSAVRPSVGIDNEPITVIELTHPLAGDLVLPAEDFSSMLARGTLTPA